MVTVMNLMGRKIVIAKGQSQKVNTEESLVLPLEFL